MAGGCGCFAVLFPPRPALRLQELPVIKSPPKTPPVTPPETPPETPRLAPAAAAAEPEHLRTPEIRKPSGRRESDDETPSASTAAASDSPSSAESSDVEPLQEAALKGDTASLEDISSEERSQDEPSTRPASLVDAVGNPWMASPAVAQMTPPVVPPIGDFRERLDEAACAEVALPAPASPCRPPAGELDGYAPLDGSSTVPASFADDAPQPGRGISTVPASFAEAEGAGDVHLAASFSDEAAFLKAYAAMTGTRRSGSQSQAVQPGPSAPDLDEGEALEMEAPQQEEEEPQQQQQPTAGAAPSPSVALKALVGHWRIVMGDIHLVCSVREDGSVLYNGKHMGDRYDIIEDDADGAKTIRRCDGWALDLKSSKVGMLVWTKPGEFDVEWHRVPVFPDAAPRAAADTEQGNFCTKTALGKRQDPDASGIIIGSSKELVQVTEVAPTGLFSCGTCRVR